MPQRFVDIRYRGLPPDWSSMESAELIEAKDGQARLRVGRDTDLSVIVAALRGTTDVTSFAYQPPTLSELFHQAVAA
jgi:ABC-2 type transport system ATP-binding protein